MSEPLDLAAIDRQWSADGGMGTRSDADYSHEGCRTLTRMAFRDIPRLIALVRELEPRVLEGDWETVRDALDALPEGAQIRWTTGDPIHVALAIHRGVHWDATVYGGPLSSDNIARDETPIEVIA